MASAAVPGASPASEILGVLPLQAAKTAKSVTPAPNRTESDRIVMAEDEEGVKVEKLRAAPTIRTGG